MVTTSRTVYLDSETARTLKQMHRAKFGDNAPSVPLYLTILTALREGESE